MLTVVASPRNAAAQERGLHELALLGLDTSNASEELDESVIGAEYDHKEEEGEDADKLRILDNFILYTEEGDLVPPSVLDKKPRGTRYFAFGTIVPNLSTDTMVKLTHMDLHYKGYPPPCVPRYYTATDVAYRQRAAAGATASAANGVAGGEDDAVEGFVGQKRKTAHSAGAPSAKRAKGGAADAGASDEQGARGNQRGEFVGTVMRRHRYGGVLLHYNDKGKATQPVEFEALEGNAVETPKGSEANASDSGAAAGASPETVVQEAELDRENLRSGTKVDVLCKYTHKWYPSKVVEVGRDGKSLKIHFNGWNAKHDEWIERADLRLAPAGSHTGGISLTNPAAAAAAARRAAMEQASTTYCITVEPRRGVRVRIEVEDWCSDFTTLGRPALWLIGKQAWYLLAGGDWWDAVEPAPAYEPVFSQIDREFQAMALVLRALQAQPKTTLAKAAPRISSWSNGAIVREDLEECHKAILKWLGEASPIPLKPKADKDLYSKDNDGPTLPAAETDLAQEIKAAGAHWEARGKPSKAEMQAARKAQAQDREAVEKKTGLTAAERRAQREQARAGAQRAPAQAAPDALAGENAPIAAALPIPVEARAPAPPAPAAAAVTHLPAPPPAPAPRPPAKARPKAAELTKEERERKEEEKLLLLQLRRYPIPDEQHWEEQSSVGLSPEPFPCEDAASPIATPEEGYGENEAGASLPPSCFGSAIGAWSVLQLFGELMHLGPFDLHSFLEALAPGSSGLALPQDDDKGRTDADNAGAEPPRAGGSPSKQPRAPAANASTADGNGGAAWPGADARGALLARIHICLLDFLAWDAVRTAGFIFARNAAAATSESGYPERLAAYWHRLFFSPDLWTKDAAEKAKAVIEKVKAAAHGGRGRLKHTPLLLPTTQAEEEEEEAAATPETTLPAHRGSWGLLRGSSAAWVEMARLIVMHKEGVLKRENTVSHDDASHVHKCGVDPAALLAIHLDPVGESGQIVRSLLATVEQDMARAATDGAFAAKPGSSGEEAVCGALKLVLERLREGWYDGFCDKATRLAKDVASLPPLSEPAPEEKSSASMAAAKRAGPGEEKDAAVVAAASKGTAESASAAGAANGNGDTMDAVASALGESGVQNVKKELVTVELKKEARSDDRMDVEDGEQSGNRATKSSGGSSYAATTAKVEASVSPVQPSLAPLEEGESYGKGHVGLAVDVSTFLNEFVRRDAHPSAAGERAAVVVDDFELLYSDRVHGPLLREAELAESGVATAPAAELARMPLDWNDWTTVAVVATTREYQDWPPQVKLRLLSWLCDAALSTDTMRELMDKAHAARAAVDKRDRDLKATARTQHKARGASPNGVAAPVAPWAATSLPGKKNGGTDAEHVQTLINGEDATMQAQRELAKLVVRLEPLGQDRDRRRYWIFKSGACAPEKESDVDDSFRDDFNEDGDNEDVVSEWLEAPLTSGAIFVEDGAKWLRLTTRQQLLDLYAWLDRRGAREKALKVLLREHLCELGASDARIARADEVQVELFAAMAVAEDNSRIREKERREREQAKAALEANAFDPQVQRNALAAACADLKVDHSILVGPRASPDATPYARGPVVLGCSVKGGSSAFGLVLAKVNGAATVQRFAKDTCAAKAAGIMVGDVLLAVNNRVTTEPSLLEAAMAESGAAAKAEEVLLRFSRMVQIEPSLEKAESSASSSGITGQDGARRASLAALLQGLLLAAEANLSHPYILAGDLLSSEARATWRTSVLDAFPVADDWNSGAKPVAVAQAVHKLAPLLLQLDEALSSRNTVLKAGWVRPPVPADDGVGPDGRKNLAAVAGVGQRRKWRRCVEEARTVGQLVLAWGALDAAVMWGVVHDVVRRIPYDKFCALLPAERRNPIPKPGDIVLYYAEGHRAAIASQHKLRRHIYPLPPQRQGSTTDQKDTGSAELAGQSRFGLPDDLHLPEGAGENAVLECRVVSAENYAGGPLGKNGSADWRETAAPKVVARRWGKLPTPYVRLELEVLPKGSQSDDGSATSTGKVSLKPSVEPRAQLCRFLRRVVSQLRLTDFAEDFVEPVNAQDFPDYYEIVRVPMDLAKLSENCVNSYYLSVGEFTAHLDLLSQNWHRYCDSILQESPKKAENFKRRVTALVFAGKAMLLAEPLNSHLKAAEAEMGKLEALWQDKMRAAIVASGAKAATVAAALGIELGAGASGGALALSPMKNRPMNARKAREVFFDRILPVTHGAEPPEAEVEAAAAAAAAATDEGASSGNFQSARRLVVCMRLAKEFPAFCVSRSEYASAVKAKRGWRMELPVHGTFPDPLTHVLRRYSGTIVGLQPQHPSGFLRWRAFRVEWEDAPNETEDGVSFVNPWEIEPAVQPTAPSAPNGAGAKQSGKSRKRPLEKA